MNRLLVVLMTALLFLIQLSCYSFKGITIADNVNTFVVLDFVTIDNDAPADIERVFSEALREKVRTESKLKQNELDPDIQFEGEITKYETSSETPVEGNTVDVVKLTIGVRVTYTNLRNEEDTWTKPFSNFRTFGADQNLLDIEEQLIDEIFEQITESVFNEAFTDW